MDNKRSESEEAASLFYYASTINKYTEEEISAIGERTEMTPKIFESCVKIALSVCDIVTVRFLKEKYPDLAKNSLALSESEKQE